MNIEDQIQAAKQYHRSLPIDLESFSDHVLTANKLYQNPSVSQRKGRLMRKTLPIVVAVLASAGLFGFTAAKLQWFGTNVTMDSVGGNISALQTPLESWTNTKQDWHIQNPLTLQEARTESSYPIREPSQIPDWTLVQSFGWGTPITKTGVNGTVSHSTGPVQFLSFWTNTGGGKIAVQQHLSNIVPGWTNVGFPAGSYQIDSFKPDLAVMMNLHNGRLELAVFHIEKNKRVSELDFYGTTSASTLESFAKDYLGPPKD